MSMRHDYDASSRGAFQPLGVIDLYLQLQDVIVDEEEARRDI